ncbi:MAG TPA: helix-turn-helix transcriptional regulator [Micromonosporaceae bacterium]
MTHTGSTVPRRELGRRLRQLRESTGMTIETAAKKLETSRPRIWRIEKGENPMRSGEVWLMCQLYGTDSETTAALMALAKETKAPEWWRAYGDAIPRALDLLLGLEQAASAFRWWEEHVIPGILQTEQYARMVMESDAGLSPDEIELRVKARLNRQELLLSRENAPRFDIVIDEIVLDRLVPLPEIAREQLDRLLETSKSLPHVTVRVVPRSAGFHAAVQAGSFTILDFPTNHNGNGEPTTVQTDGWITPVYYTKPEEVARFVDTFYDLAKRSLDEDASRDFIQNLRSQL